MRGFGDVICGLAEFRVGVFVLARSVLDRLSVGLRSSGLGTVCLRAWLQGI